MSSTGLVIRRSRQAQQFVCIPNDLARTGALSLRARGLLVMLLSFPPDWRTTTTDIAQGCPEGRDAVRTAMRELRNAGYVVLVTERGGGGRFTRHLEVFDTPQESSTEDAVSPHGARAPGTPAESAPPQDSRGSGGQPPPAKTDVCPGHTEDGIPGPGEPTVGGPGVLTKTVNENGKDGREDLASRQARTKRASAKRTVSSVIKDVRSAAVEVFGPEDAGYLRDAEALGLWARYAARAKVRDLRSYLVRIFGDGDYLDTFLSKSAPMCPRCVQYEDECRHAAAA